MRFIGSLSGVSWDFIGILSGVCGPFIGRFIGSRSKFVGIDRGFIGVLLEIQNGVLSFPVISHALNPEADAKSLGGG